MDDDARVGCASCRTALRHVDRAALMTFVLFEKLAPFGAYGARLRAIVLIGAAAWIIGRQGKSQMPNPKSQTPMRLRTSS